jgi:hypothetical protein
VPLQWYATVVARLRCKLAQCLPHSPAVNSVGKHETRDVSSINVPQRGPRPDAVDVCGAVSWHILILLCSYQHSCFGSLGPAKTRLMCIAEYRCTSNLHAHVLASAGGIAHDPAEKPEFSGLHNVQRLVSTYWTTAVSS